MVEQAFGRLIYDLLFLLVISGCDLYNVGGM